MTMLHFHSLDHSVASDDADTPNEALLESAARVGLYLGS